MATNSRHLEGVKPEQVFDALRDGKSYGYWVVGTRKIREVEPGWPKAGSAIHYTVGYGPLRKDDHTKALHYEPDRRLELEAQAWPAGSVGILFTVEPEGNGTTVTLEEAPRAGLAKTLHNPVLDLLIKARNVETLRRLERVIRIRAS